MGSVAGIIVAPLTMTAYDVGIMLGLKGFCAAIIGGMSSGVATVVGGLILGVLESLGAGLDFLRIQGCDSIHHPASDSVYPPAGAVRQSGFGEGMTE